MYIFHTDRGPTFLTMHYERLDGGDDPSDTVYLGHTIVRTEQQPRPHIGIGLILPRQFLQDAGVMPRTLRELEALRQRNIAEAPRYPDLPTFVEEGTLAWRGLLAGVKPLHAQTRYAESVRTVADPVLETVTESGLILVSSNANPEHPLQPQTITEFDRWVATAPEIESIDQIAQAVDIAVAVATAPPDDVRTGMYL